jgi:hypothetical protein
VSVVVATYNRAQYLGTALDSLLSQTRLPDEVIVVDDGSSDRTPDVVRAYGSRIRSLRQPENSGKSAALNRAIPLALGTHLWIFDDDDLALPDALESQLDFIAQHPEVDFTYSSNYVFHGDGDIHRKDKWQLDEVPRYRIEEFFVRHALNTFAIFQGMLVPKRCFSVVGHFNPSLVRSQDNDMILRLARKFSASNIGKPTFVLRYHSGLRGSAGNQTSAAMRLRVWQEYDQKIYVAARREYPLSAYLPHVPSDDAGPFDDDKRGEALLQRAAIMLRKGLTEECLDDLASAADVAGRLGPSTARLEAIVSAGFNVEPWRLSHWFRFSWKARSHLGRMKPLPLQRAAARGTYWSLSTAWRQRRYVDALVSATMLAVLLLPANGQE